MSVLFGQRLPYGMTSEELIAFFNLSPDLFCIISADRFFKYVNPAWENVLGWSHEELFGKPINSFIHPDELKEIVRNCAFIIAFKSNLKVNKIYGMINFYA